jgi:hypothetical protein
MNRDGFMKNAFVEKKSDRDYDTFRRPGLTAFSTGTDAIGQGITGYRNTVGDEFLFAGFGGQFAAVGLPAPSTEWEEVSTGLTDAGVGTLRYGSMIRFGGILWAIGGSTNSDSTQAFRFVVHYSTDNGTTWTKVVDVADNTVGYPRASNFNILCVHDGRIVLGPAGNGFSNFHRQSWSSGDGVNWTQDSAATGVPVAAPLGVVSHSDGAMYAFFEATTDPVWKSTDGGATWASTAASAAYNSGGGARENFTPVSLGGYLWVMGGTPADATAQKIYKSVDGVTWAEHGTNALSSVVASTTNSVLVPINQSGVFYLFEFQDGVTRTGNIWTSPNATTWTLVSTYSIADATDPFWSPDRNYNGKIVKSGSYFFGMAWEAPASGGSMDNIFRLPLSANPLSISVGATGAGYLDFSQNYARSVLVVRSNSQLAVVDTTTFILTVVSDTDYPNTTVRGLVYLDGFFFVMDGDGNIYNSDEEAPTSWDPTNFVAAQFEPDGGVALAKYNLYIVAFGEYTTEFFWNAGNAAGSPLLPVQQGVMNAGCVDGDTVGQIDSQIIWLAQSKSAGQGPAKGRFVAQLQGNSYIKLSTPDIDRILDADDLLDVDATTFKVGGHSYYHLRLGGSNISLLYDLSEQQWYVWNRRRDSFTASISSVVIANGTATATVTSSWADGDVAIISGFTGTYTALNGTHNLEVSSNVYKWPVTFTGTSTSTGTGTGTGWTEDDLGIVSACSFEGRQLLQDKSNGDLYELDGTTCNDNSIYMDWLIRSIKIDGGSVESKFAAWADMVSDRVSGNAMLRFSDDDCQNFTKFRKRSLAGARTRWHRLGSFRRRVWEVRVTDAIQPRAQYLEIADSQGSAPPTP